MTTEVIYLALKEGDYKTVTTEVKKLDKAYRDGDPLISDPEYDRLIDTIKIVNPENEIFVTGQIQTVNSDRKEELQFPMYSLDKEKYVELIQKWLSLKGLPQTTVLICTAKYDGISILKDEELRLAWTKGDGVYGESLKLHYEKLCDKGSKIKIFTIGEMIIPKPVFSSKTFYRDNGLPFKNARNMMAGMKNNDTPSEDLKYVKHIRYGFATEDFTKNKSEQLDFISKNFLPVPYKVFRACDLKIEELNELFVEWGKEYDIDGLVFDIEDKDIRKKLGREKNNNPAYARAFKNPEWSEKNEVPERGIEWNLSKTKALKPVVLIEPFDVEGVTISRVTGYNAKFILENSIGKGSILEIVRSGGVIPKIIGVIENGVVDLPTICPSCCSILEWNENGVDLICNNVNCGEVNFQKLTFFFVRFKITGFAEKTIKKFYDAGYDTVGKILSMSLSDIQRIEGMAHLSATKLLKEFGEKIKSAPFEVIGHASGCFENIGSRKLKMIVEGVKESISIPNFTFATSQNSNTENFGIFQKALAKMDLSLIVNMLQYDLVKKELIEKLNTISGMSNKTSESFLTGLVLFNKFMDGLDITISDETKVKKEESKNNSTNMKKIDLTGREFVFTGFRDSELKSFIEESNGVVKDGITKSTTDLITKNEDSTSSKAIKAKNQGARVTQVDIFKNSLK